MPPDVKSEEQHPAQPLKKRKVSPSKNAEANVKKSPKTIQEKEYVVAVDSPKNPEEKVVVVATDSPKPVEEPENFVTTDSPKVSNVRILQFVFKE